MDHLKSIEKEFHIILPDIYVRFYNLCAVSMPDNLIGTDLLNNFSYNDLRNSAEELLHDDGVDNFLKNDDFVFMVHQGYMFWYFTADGEADPNVFGYYEGKNRPDNLGHFSNFLNQYEK